LVAAGENGLEGINPVTREQKPQQWRAAVEAIANVLAAQRPSIIFFPHDDDWNKTHIGVHYLVREALSSAGLSCQVVETEFWGAMDAPNLMVESSAADVADLVAALSLHVGEVARNAYHLRLPAWMIDNVRRGAELVGGQGGTAPRFAFATLYRLSRWQNGRIHDVFEGGRVLSSQDDLSKLFQPQRETNDGSYHSNQPRGGSGTHLPVNRGAVARQTRPRAWVSYRSDDGASL
jgi:hypothetical protein